MLHFHLIAINILFNMQLRVRKRYIQFALKLILLNSTIFISSFWTL